MTGPRALRNTAIPAARRNLPQQSRDLPLAEILLLTRVMNVFYNWQRNLLNCFETSFCDGGYMELSSFLAICLFIAAVPSGHQNASKYGLPTDALIVEERPLQSEGHSDRALVLWMVKPEKHPLEYGPDDPYACPDTTRGSYYSGPTRVSLIDIKTKNIVNTVAIKQEYNGGMDSFDLPYAIRQGHYYKVEGKPNEGEEVNPNLIWLKDYNGDGKILEFALFDALSCMGLPSTLIGYSDKQDKVMQYEIHLKTNNDKEKINISRWCDYLYEQKPQKSGYWQYEIDYRGRGGSLNKYEIKYNANKEWFEGSCIRINDEEIK
ncbi:hypothetical protein VU07_00265 [Desulfobulbus sp. F4]|nr:hypothetical protein [Desulfobulbus sp. F3]MCW5200245.1 hypothetical protein [Desulfobulbus sp. F4]